jgi:hypothetical protein
MATIDEPPEIIGVAFEHAEEPRILQCEPGGGLIPN